MLPFTREQFFAIFLEYNNAVWPASILAYGLGILALIAVLRPKPVWSKAYGFDFGNDVGLDWGGLPRLFLFHDQ